MNKEKLISLTVRLSKNNVKNEVLKDITFPMSNEELEKVKEELYTSKSANYAIVDTKSNINISPSEYKYCISHLLDFSNCYRFFQDNIKEENFWGLKEINNIMNKLNSICNWSEIQALSEYLEIDFSNMLNYTISGKYHFNRIDSKSIQCWFLKSLDNNIAILDYMPKDNDEIIRILNNEELLDRLADKGYFIATTGILHILDVSLYAEARKKYDKQKMEKAAIQEQLENNYKDLQFKHSYTQNILSVISSIDSVSLYTLIDTTGLSYFENDDIEDNYNIDSQFEFAKDIYNKNKNAKTYNLVYYKGLLNLLYQKIYNKDYSRKILTWEEVENLTQELSPVTNVLENTLKDYKTKIDSIENADYDAVMQECLKSNMEKEHLIPDNFLSEIESK